jgi:hypothetical protein
MTQMSESETISVGSASVAPPAVAANRLWISLRSVVSFPALMAVLLVAVALIGAQDRLIDPDTWWHVTVGEQILRTHTWPTSDTYSFTARGAGWIAYEWLGEVFLALAARAGGLMGLVVLQKAIVALVALLLYYYAYLQSGNTKAACVASTIVLPIAPMAFTLRPQMIGYVFLLVTLICLERFRQGHTKSLWFLPPLFVVWANTHGSFVFGLLVIGLYWVTGLVTFQVGGLIAERLPRRHRVQLLITLLLCLLALLVTPYGSQIAANPFEMATAQPVNIANVQEWQPLSLAMPLGKYFLVFAIALFLIQVTLQLTYKLEDMAMLLFGAYAMCAHMRFAMVFVIFLAPILAGIASRFVPAYDPAKDRYLLNFALMVLVVFALLKLRPSTYEIEKVVAEDYPVNALDYLRQHPQPTGLFNEYGWGGYLISQLGPEHQVFIDGRADLYEYSGIFPDYLIIFSAQPDAMRVLNRHNIQSCLIRRTSHLALLLAASPGWQQAYSDDLAAIFIRTGSAAQGPQIPGAAQSRVSLKRATL